MAAGAAPVTSLRNPLTRTLIALTVTTGLVDAGSYLGLGHVFAANMTGNIVLLGFGVAGGTGLPVTAPIIALMVFLVGAGTGAVLAARFPGGSPRHLVAAAGFEAVTLLVAAVLAACIHLRPLSAAGDLVIAVLALGMGVRNATARTLAVPDLNTTVLTMTLTAFASGLPPFGGDGRGTLRRGAAVVAMFAGALIGALLVKTSLVWPFALGAGLNVAALAVHLRATAAPAS